MAQVPSTVPLVPVPTFSQQQSFSTTGTGSSAGVPFSPLSASSPGSSSYGMPPSGFVSSPTFSAYSGPALAVGAAGTPMGAQTVAGASNKTSKNSLFSCVINSDSDLDFMHQSPIALLFWLLFHFNSYSLALPLHFRFVSTIFSFVQNLVFVHI
jgi:hypothetical protein